MNITAKLAPKVIPIVQPIAKAVKRHRVVVHIAVLLAIICLIVVWHEGRLGMVAIAYKFTELFCDVCADRLFPSSLGGD